MEQNKNKPLLLKSQKWDHQLFPAVAAPVCVILAGLPRVAARPAWAGRKLGASERVGLGGGVPDPLPCGPDRWGRGGPGHRFGAGLGVTGSYTHSQGPSAWEDLVTFRFF